MSYYNDKKNIKDTTQNKTVAVATYEVGAEIIVKALNYYFEKKRFTSNESIEMMNSHTSNSLKKIADLAEKQKMEADELIDYLREISEEMAAQALVVSMRDELKFGSPEVEG